MTEKIMTRRAQISWTPELIAHVHRLRSDFDLSFATIADRLCTSAGAIKRLISRTGAPKRATRKWTRDETERAIDAEMDGDRIAVIAARLGRTCNATKTKLDRERQK